jgi:hypothetical protein
MQHPGRKSATGFSSVIPSMPGGDAKDFEKNLDSYKAQTFIPMVSALKGMGALSDAEGKKLTESVGALDVGMSEKGFTDSLRDVNKRLFEKAKAAGLNVNLPAQFAPQENAQPAAPAQPAMENQGGWKIRPKGQ